MAQLICVYVPSAATRNLDHGLTYGIWGFKPTVAEQLRSEFVYNNDSYVLFATGGPGLVDSTTWNAARFGIIYLAKVSTGLYHESSLEWSDETESPIYTERFKFDPASVVSYSSIQINQLPTDVSDKLKRSSTTQSRGCLVSDINIEELKNILNKNRNKVVQEEINESEEKKLEDERLGGVVVCDSTGWKEGAIEAKSTADYIVLWWDKMPSGGQPVIELLREAIQNSDERSFYIYYTINQVAEYRSRVVDFATEKEYSDKRWNEKGEVAWFKSSFSEYKGGEKTARIVFLCDRLEDLKVPIELKYFEFYKDHHRPTQNNMQPYTKINLKKVEPKTNSMKPLEIIQHIHKYITSKGFQYQFEEIANFYLSLRAKPFVILAGISGTGKTQLPRKFAAALGMQKYQIIQVPVRPDWADGSDLLGYTGLDGKFIPKAVTLAIKEANNHPQEPFFFILDEMNLARVEHYFSEFLSVIETRREEGEKIITDPLLRKEASHGLDGDLEYQGLGWPENLYLIGTVNMDETTHAFSRKVLDRANSIEMNEVNLDWPIIPDIKIQPLSQINNSFFKTEFIGSMDLTDSDKESIQGEMELLVKVNKILEEADLHFAYRVRDEVAFYLVLNKRYNLIDNHSAIDFQLAQKILPRIHGSSDRVQVVLVKLLILLEKIEVKIDGFEFSQIKDINIDGLIYKRTSKKIRFMLKRFDDDRFTSFWV